MLEGKFRNSDSESDCKLHSAASISAAMIAALNDRAGLTLVFENLSSRRRNSCALLVSHAVLLVSSLHALLLNQRTGTNMRGCKGNDSM